MEEAGKKNDVKYIEENYPAMLEEYLEYQNKLERLNPSASTDLDKEPIPLDELAGAIEAIKELAPQMDRYDYHRGK